MSYKSIIQNQEFRLNILKFLKFIPDKTMIKIQYWMKLKRIPNLKEPTRFTEKIQWYKLFYRNDLMTIAADKYEVRNYIKSKKLGHILTDLLGVYKSPSDIKIEDLPSKFILKTTNGSGTNFISTDKSKVDFDKLRVVVQKWLKRDMFAAGREWAYRSVEPLIIIEELLEDTNKPDSGISDYKFLCFDGEPSYVILDVDRFAGHKRNIYDLSWQLVNVSTDKDNIEEKISKPDNLEEMIEIAKILSEDFPFVRVDLYSVNQKIYFGELTFYPWTGYVAFNPDEFDFTLGQKFNIVSKNNK